VDVTCCPGALLKEAVDDLEWPGGSVVIKLTRDPAAISMVARGTGSLEVCVGDVD
jgi:cell cycle checkpoint protein